MSGSINSRVKQKKSSKQAPMMLRVLNEDGTPQQGEHSVFAVPVSFAFAVAARMNRLMLDGLDGFGEGGEPTVIEYNERRGVRAFGMIIRSMDVSVKGDNELHVRYTSEKGQDLTELLKSTLFIRAAYSLLGADLTPEEVATVDVRIRYSPGAGRKKKQPEPARDYLKPIHLGKALARVSNPTLFDVETSAGRGEASGVIIGEITEAKLKMVDALMDLLNSTSQTRDKEAADYFMGNAGGEIVKMGKTKRGQWYEAAKPAIRVTPYELARAYKGGATPSGKDVENAMATLDQLDRDMYMFHLTFKDDNNTEYEYRKRDKLIELEVARKKSITDTGEINTKEALVIKMSALFRLQIEKLFIKYPHDMLRRTMEAYNKATNTKRANPSIPTTVFLLRDFLLSEMVHKRTTGRANEIITMSKLVERIAWKHLQQRKKTRAREHTKTAIRAMEHMGIIHGHRIEKSKTTGEDMVVFDINKDWPERRSREVEIELVKVENVE